MLFVSELLYKCIHAQTCLEQCERVELPGLVGDRCPACTAYKGVFYGIQMDVL